MKRLALLALCVPLLIGNACTNTPLLNGQSVTQVAGISKESTQALTVAHQSYNGLSRLLIQAASSGLLKGNNAALAQVYYNKAGDALDVADAAYAAANERDLLKAIADTNSAIAQAKKLTGG